VFHIKTSAFGGQQSTLTSPHADENKSKGQQPFSDERETRQRDQNANVSGKELRVKNEVARNTVMTATKMSLRRDATKPSPASVTLYVSVQYLL
jgi:hypothetical protein